MNQKEKPDWRALSPVVRLALGAAVLLVAALAVYWPGLNGGYILDDDLWVNASRKTFAGLMEIWRASKTPDFFPLTSTTFWLEWPLWGLDPLGYHLVNVLIHWASAVVLWRVLRRLAIPGAWLGAMLFVVHPVNVESVIWISQRKNTLSMFFFLSTLWGYVRSEEKSGEDPEKLEPPSSFYYGLSLFFFVLALLSKTAVVMLPVVLLGCAWWLRGRIVLRDWLRSLPFFGLAATLGVVTICLQTSRAIGADVVNTADFWGRLTGAGRAVWFYFEKAVWPMNLAFVYPRWELNGHLAAAYLPLAAMVLVAGILWWYRRTTMGRSLCFALGYFVVMLLPVLGFVDIYYFRYSRVADHWQYYSLIGIIALAAGWLGASFKFQLSHFKLWLTVIIVAGLSVSAWRQVRLYRSPDVLWENLLVKDPACWLAHNLLGHRAGFTPGAAAHFRASLRLKPDQMEALLNLGAIELRLNLDDEAMADYAQAKKIAPNVPMVEVGLGLVYEKCTNLLAAEAAFRRATKLEPDNALYHRLLGSALQAEGLLFQSLVEKRSCANGSGR